MIAEFDHLLLPIRQYLDRYPVSEDELQQRMRARAVAEGHEHWIIPPEVGRLFYLLTKMTNARLIYEIGSYLGYSATWFVKALPEDGTVVLTENHLARFQQAVAFCESSPLERKAVVKHCDALVDLEATEERFDIILIDHDKPYYCDAFRVAKRRVRQGGLIIADNVLWRNRIVDPKWVDDPSTRGILEFNRLLMNDPEVVSLIVPIGDGVSLSYIL